VFKTILAIRMIKSLSVNDSCLYDWMGSGFVILYKQKKLSLI